MSDDFQVIFSGQGPQRWSIVGPSAIAVGLPTGAVRGSLTAQSGNPLTPQEILVQMQRWHDQGLAVAGWLSYELGMALEGIELPDETPPLIADLVAFSAADLQPMALPQPMAMPALPLPRKLLEQKDTYLHMVDQALLAIGAGEVYQVNLSLAAEIPQTGALFSMPLAWLAGAQQAAQPVGFGMAWQGDAARPTVISGSMERFLKVVRGEDQNFTVYSRPIKGTAPRRLQPEADQAQAEALRSSVKECAENTMIVDMVRNDLRRACRSGTVQVPTWLAPCAYQTLWHLESEVLGILDDPHNIAALMRATLPPASVTGCPKVQAMRVIARLEQRLRGPYCGCAGYWLPDGQCEWSVGIRQVHLRATGATQQVGAGIVADSTAEGEWAELLLKAQSALRMLATARRYK